MTPETQSWFAVRCVFGGDPQACNTYEERVTLWQARDFDEAIALAEAEAEDYARDLPDTEYLGLAQSYQLFDEPGHGAEVFSLPRDSPLGPDEYLTAFFSTGGERTQDWKDPSGE